MASDVVRGEVQMLRTASTAVNSSADALAGNFRLSWGKSGEETDYLPAEVGEAELEAALEALADVRDVQVDSTGGFKVTYGRNAESETCNLFRDRHDRKTTVTARRIVKRNPFQVQD